MIRSVIPKLLALTGLVAVGNAFAQPDLIDEAWLQLQTPHFSVISQKSERNSRRVANELESWRRVAAALLNEPSRSSIDTPDTPFPASPVPNIVYLFDSDDDYQLFVGSGDPGYFVNTPRANYMAVVAGNEESIAVASHHYAHFLIRNFADLSLPRWFEEGMAAYMARVQIEGQSVEFDRFSRTDYETMVALSESFPMERLFYRDDALASPRVIQIANLKSESLLQYLLHAYEEEDFVDRRSELAQYLDLLRQGRNPRFAYDRAFAATTDELEQEFHHYLINSRRPAVTLPVAQLPEPGDYQAVQLQKHQLALTLAELALNMGKFALAESFYRTAADAGSTLPRVQAGIADALRMQDAEAKEARQQSQARDGGARGEVSQGRDQIIARQFTEALALGPDDINTLLDFGEYWEVELQDCDKSYPAGQRQQLMAQMEQSFSRAVILSPDNAEANLAMAQYYLFSGQQWQQGLVYQRKAFALLPADTFVMEQAVKYAIAAGAYDEAEKLIAKLAAPIHFWGEPDWVQDLRVRLLKHQRGEAYDPCGN